LGLYKALLLLHIVLTSAWLGGILFIPLVLVPLLRGHNDRPSLIIRAGKILDKIAVKVLFPGIFITGIWLGVIRSGGWIPFITFSEASRLIWLKVAIFLIMAVLQIIHNYTIGQKIEKYINEPVKYRKMAVLSSWSGRIALVLSLALLYLCISLRV